jgi:hypothetical protein
MREERKVVAFLDVIGDAREGRAVLATAKKRDLVYY